MKHRWHNQFTTLDANSKFHNEARAIFASDPYFRMLKCYQEVPVADIAPWYLNKRHRFDWYIEDLDVVIELHGRQHYKMVNYGNISHEDATRAFKEQQSRDIGKKAAAQEAGLRYVEIPHIHRTKLTAELLKQLILYGDEDDS